MDLFRKKLNYYSLEAMKSMTAFEVFDKISIHFIMNDEKYPEFYLGR